MTKQRVTPTVNEIALANVAMEGWGEMVEWDTPFDRVLRKGLSEEMIFKQRSEGRVRREYSVLIVQHIQRL